MTTKEVGANTGHARTREVVPAAAAAAAADPSPPAAAAAAAATPQLPEVTSNACVNRKYNLLDRSDSVAATHSI